MKAKLAIVFGVLAATVLLVVLMTVSPDQGPALIPQATTPAAPKVVPPATATETQSAAAAVPPSPLSTEEELAGIEERIEGSTERMPALDRLKLWWELPGPQMSGDDYEKARGLYLRFLDHFARMTAGRFRVEDYRTLKDGSEELFIVDDVIWSLSSYRAERIVYESGKEPTKYVMVSNGEQYCEWENGRKIHSGRARGWGVPGHYMFRMEMTLIREAHPFFLNWYTNCDIDNGSTGYSRLWNANGAEARFDTATALLTDRRDGDGGRHTYTYQDINGLWFPLEIAHDFAETSGEGQDVLGMRGVFSRVVLNEPVDESLFDLNNPG